METLSFTLGILSVIIIAAVIVLVWGTVKVLKQEKEIKNLNTELERAISDIYRNSSDETSRLNRRLNDMDRNAYEQMKSYFDENKSYTDKRIDKLVDTYFEIKEINKKQLIKG